MSGKKPLALFGLFAFALCWVPLVRAEGPELVPAKLSSNEVTVKLPAACDDICVGGGGRYLKGVL